MHRDGQSRYFAVHRGTMISVGAGGFPAAQRPPEESWHFVDTSPAAGAVFDASLRPAINDVPGLPC